MKADPYSVGEAVLAAFAEGRQKAIEFRKFAAEPLERAVRAALDDDIIRGNPERGRAGRIAWQLHKRERTVRKVLARLMSRAGNPGFNQPINNPESPR